MKSTIVKRTIVIAGHKTSVSLEDEFGPTARQFVIGDSPFRSQLLSKRGQRRGSVRGTEWKPRHFGAWRSIARAKGSKPNPLLDNTHPASDPRSRPVLYRLCEGRRSFLGGICFRC
jgi:hypothetical protein